MGRRTREQSLSSFQIVEAPKVEVLYAEGIVRDNLVSPDSVNIEAAFPNF